MEEAVVKVAEVVKLDSNYGKWKDASGKTWNVGEESKKFLKNASDGKPIFSEGRKLKVAYIVNEPTGGRKYGSRWVKDVAPAGDDDPLTWPDREPWEPRSGGNHNQKTNGEFRTPEQIMRGQALECAVALVHEDGISGALDTAKQFYAYILGDFEAKLAVVADAFEATGTDDDDIPFDTGPSF